ncbi:alpha/beta fold hydrolase [Stenotrophobium rhamnosiphilum]|uniref:Alpha/beta hydrolase n=1 Tax=Stenotrophobium rhamnosiphilum TaxID=2029166 RepID=A0A2T5MBU9_9GAMM|nr:alpha/beta fold hydrolase [Stenotrophobium rhamnosiphilum]PTU30057.1 alpha/beta hydrolase [Stenotrophobium rhamnosiphilum]
MPRISANGLEFEYETFGNAKDPVLLLIMGLGGQLTQWPDDFCTALAQGGYYVIRYDNRDVGLSTRLGHLGKAKLMSAGILSTLRLPVKAPYKLDDMAADAVGLLDALSIPSAHIVGISMGGMIGQIVAAKHAARVRSFVSIMSSSGHKNLPGPSLRIQKRLVKRPKTLDRESLIAHGMETWRLIGSPAYPTSTEALRAKVEGAFNRASYPQGLGRQTLAILASGSRMPLLPKITAPTLVIHGDKDPLVPVAAAYNLARFIPGAKLEIIQGMGHDLPPQLLPKLQGMILSHVKSAA